MGVHDRGAAANGGSATPSFRNGGAVSAKWCRRAVTAGTLPIKAGLTPLSETMNQAGRQDVVPGKMWYHGDQDL